MINKIFLWTPVIEHSSRCCRNKIFMYFQDVLAFILLIIYACCSSVVLTSCSRVLHIVIANWREVKCYGLSMSGSEKVCTKFCENKWPVSKVTWGENRQPCDIIKTIYIFSFWRKEGWLKCGIYYNNVVIEYYVVIIVKHKHIVEDQWNWICGNCSYISAFSNIPVECY
jgi:hypothetical protein